MKKSQLVGARSSRRGAAAAECAIVLPVLLLIVLGAVDFGRFLYTYIAVTNSARAGAGYASVNPYTSATYATWESQTRQACKDEMSTFDLSTMPNPVVTPTVVSSVVDRVSVKVSYPFSPLVAWPGIPSSLTVQRVVVMRCIR